MPEKTKSAYYYGQDYAVISKYMDVVMPMIYKGNYHKSTSWITTTTQWYKTNSKGAKVPHLERILKQYWMEMEMDW